jgi:hypothetical protein
MPVKPRDAATVMLLRNSTDGADDIEVLMVRRHAKSRFVPDAYVYPGGRIEEADYASEIEQRCVGLGYAEAQRRVPDIRPPEKSLGAWVAGIRETFEEVAILYAYDKSGDLVELAAGGGDRLESYRRRLHADEISLVDLLDQNGLTLATDELHYFAHWITPETSPMRYDVRFFVAPAPADQDAQHDGVELTEHVWIQPREALAKHEKGEFPVILPTHFMLQELSRFRTVEDAVASTRGKEIPAILSKVILRNGEYVEVMPDEDE